MSKHLNPDLATTLTGDEETRRHLVTPQRRPFLIVLVALIFMAAVWFSLVFIVPKPPTVDQRVYNIAAQLRCPVCQNESVADATAPVALDLRQEIRQQVLSGKSDQQVIQFFIDRYGEQTIIYAPQWQGFSLLMWLVPIALMLGGLVLVYFIARDWQDATHATTSALTATEERTLSAEERDLEKYRALLEQELADDDPLFKRSITEA
ncbi:cytochrome c-type biogenesis protein CcmH [Ktedonobacteria bacterium brp13]|nr:cytochrome c-type biogenesis protein CcmH [Ktedonobacteria bacterium brp13]